MGVIQIKGPKEAPTITPAVHLSCWIKKTWADSWQYCPYYEPISAVEAIAPSMSRAEFLYHYGKIKREDLTSFDDWAPEPNEEYYIQIRSMDAEGSHVLWTGIITDDEYNIYGATLETNPTGIQTITAYGLEHLLDRKSIVGAFCKEEGETHQIGWTPTFNERHHRGASLMGNRSTSVDSNGVYIFSKDGKVWTHLDIIEYFLKFYHPEGTIFELGGQYSILNEIKTVQRFEGLTLRQALNKLIDRRRGLGWCIRTIGSGIITIHIFTVFENSVSVGDITIPSNQEQYSMIFDEAIDIKEALVKLSTSSCYDKIIVQGARMKSCFTVSFEDGTLEEAWTPGEETAYKAGDTTEDTNPAKNDAERKTDKFDRVYQIFRIPTNWDWKAGNGTGGHKYNAAPGVDKDGNLDTNKSQSVWNFARAFLRELPIEKPAGKTNAEPEFLQPMVFVKNPADNKYYQIDKIDPMNKNPGQIRMLDREMGIEVKMKINHLLALNHFDPTIDKPTGTQPEINYESIIATVFAETDERIKVEVDIPQNQQSASLKTLVIDVEDAEFWYIVPGTVIKTKDGELQYDSGGAERDDSGRLRTIAALAKAWYSQKRAAVSLTVKNIAEYSPVGTFVISASSSWHQEQIGTVVSQRTWDFKNATTKVETGFFELDISAIVDIPNMSDLRAVSRAFYKQQKEITELRQHVGNLPVRIPVGIPAEGAEDEGQLVDYFIDNFEREDADTLGPNYTNPTLHSIRSGIAYQRTQKNESLYVGCLNSPDRWLKTSLYFPNSVVETITDIVHDGTGYKPPIITGESKKVTTPAYYGRWTFLIRRHDTISTIRHGFKIQKALFWHNTYDPIWYVIQLHADGICVVANRYYYYWMTDNYTVWNRTPIVPSGITEYLYYYFHSWIEPVIYGEQHDKIGFIPSASNIEVSTHFYGTTWEIYLEGILKASGTNDTLIESKKTGFLLDYGADQLFSGCGMNWWKAWIDTIEEPEFE